MGKAVKWFVVFSILLVWSLTIVFEMRKGDLLRQEMVGAVEAMSLEEAEALGSFIYDKDTMRVITEDEMEEHLFHSDFNITIAVDLDNPGDYAMFKFHEGRWVGRTHCQVTVLLEDNPVVLKVFPSLIKHVGPCTRGFGTGMIMPMSPVS